MLHFLQPITKFALVVSVLGLTSCSKAPTTSTAEAPKASPTAAPKLSEIFKSQLIQYLKDAGKLSTESSEGINVITLAGQLTEVKATYDLVEETWPPGFAPTARDSFNKSHEGYALALDLWRHKDENHDNPTEPNINGWAKYQSYAGDALIVKVWENDSFVEQYRGKRYLPFDENIRILLTAGALNFKVGRAAVLKELP